MKDAKLYYDKVLLRKYILGSFKKLMTNKKNKIEQADDYRKYSLKKELLRKLRNASDI